MQESLFASVDYGLIGESSGLTPSKRSTIVSIDDMENVHISSTKIIKEVKKEK